jgi:hypothetical protein
VEETELQSSVCLGLGLVFGLGDVHQLSEMVDGHLHVAALGIHISQELVRLALLVTTAGLELELAHLQELRQLGYRFFKVTKLLINETNALVALSLLLLIVGALAGLQALFKVLERAIELLPLLEVDGNDLVHAHQLLGDVAFNLRENVVDRLLQGRLQVVHGLEDVEHLLLADAEALVGFGLALWELGFDGHVKATLVEVGGSFPVVELLELLGHSEVLVEALLDLVVVTTVVLCLLQILAQGMQ